MLSPFPGMGPFLEDERLWPLFQHTLIACLREGLQAQLTSAHEVLVGERCYGCDLGEGLVRGLQLVGEAHADMAVHHARLALGVE